MIVPFIITDVHPCHHILTDEMFRYEEVSILEGSVLGPGPHYWGLGAQQTKARPAKRYRKCINYFQQPLPQINQYYNEILFLCHCYGDIYSLVGIDIPDYVTVRSRERPGQYREEILKR